MQFDTLLFERRDGVAHVTLNRPDKLNALNLGMVTELHAAAVAVASDDSLRAVLLTGAGSGFCAGADLARDDFFAEHEARPGARIGESLKQHFNPMILAWHDLPKPSIVAVNGAAAGAGMSLALVGDLVIAARSAVFVQAFAPKVGLMPDLGGTFHLPRMVGTARAKGLALLGEPLSAADAAAWGLIWESVPDESLLERAGSLARRLANGPTQAYRRIKAAFDHEPAHQLREQLSLEATAQAELGDTEDFLEGVRAFRAKRAPLFKGR